MINCKIELDLTWSEDYIISEILTDIEVPASIAPNPSIAPLPKGYTTDATFEITRTNLYIAWVTLSLNDSINILENIKLRFKRITSWNKLRSEISTLTKGNSFDYMIDMTLRNINRLFVLSFKNSDNDPEIYYFDKYYMPLIEIKDFNALIDNKPFFINIANI